MDFLTVVTPGARIVGDAHPQTARMLNNLADLLRDRGRLEEEALLRLAVLLFLEMELSDTGTNRVPAEHTPLTWVPR